MAHFNLNPYRPLFSRRPSVQKIAMISIHGYVAAKPPLGAIDTGGQIVYVLELSKKLAQLGFDVDIFTRAFEGQPLLEEVDAKVRIVRIPCGGNEFIRKEYLFEHLPEWIDNCAKVLRAYGLNYRFINSHYWDAGYSGQKLAEMFVVPHIHTPHSLGTWKKRQMEQDYPENVDAFEAQYNFSTRIREERLIYESCDQMIATTELQQSVLIEDYGLEEERISLLPPGYDDSRFFPVGEATRDIIRHRLGFNDRTVLSLGRLARNKGYDLLIRAFAVAAKRLDDLRLVLAVGGENMNDFEQGLVRELHALCEELQLEKRVSFLSFIPDDDLPDYYRAADMFVLPSRYEPFGMTAIEAMASGTPTVVTTNGGLYKLLSFGRHALFADSFDAEDLGIMMVKPFKHPKLKSRLSRMGAHKARSLFTWTGIAQQLVSTVEGRGGGISLADTEWEEPWNDGD